MYSEELLDISQVYSTICGLRSLFINGGIEPLLVEYLQTSSSSAVARYKSPEKKGPNIKRG